MIVTLIILTFLPYIQGQGKILVTSGFHTLPNNPAVKTEIIDLLDETNICDPLPDFPVDVFGTEGGVVQVLNRYAALVCGGSSPGILLDIDPRCYAIYEDATTVIGMTIHRIYPKAILVNNTNLWV